MTGTQSGGKAVQRAPDVQVRFYSNNLRGRSSMSDKKYQIFISSTFRDLKEHRLAAMNAVIDLRHIPIGMEGFPAVDEEQMNYIRRLIDETDYYVLIVGSRYGSTNPDGISYTELEYDYAVATKKYVLAFLNNSDDKNSDNPKALESFKAKVMTGRIIKEWKELPELELAVYKSLSSAFEAHPMTGWIKGDSAATETVLNDLNELRKQNDLLRAELERAQPPATIENLAPIEGNFSHRYIIKVWARDDYQDAPRVLNKSWQQFFEIVGPATRVPARMEAVSEAIGSYLVNEGVAPEFGLRLNPNDTYQLLNQLELYGLVSSAVLNTVGGRQGIFYELTPNGTAALMSAKAVRISDT